MCFFSSSRLLKLLLASEWANLSTCLHPPRHQTTMIIFKRKQHFAKVFSRIRSWKISEIMRRSSFYDGKHGDATRPSFLCGISCGWIKKRCQRQIIYFSRRSVIKLFAGTPQTGFLRSPITVEIIIIGTVPSSFGAGKKCKARYVSVGNVVKLNIGGRNAKSSLSVWYAGVKCWRWQHDDYTISTYDLIWRCSKTRIWVDEIVNLLTYNWWDVRWKTGIWMKLNKIYSLLGAHTNLR